MKIIAILSQKGGAGKTTLAIHLAVAAGLMRHEAVIIDLDPQSSATSWKDSREGDTPVVVSAQFSRLATVLEAAKKGGADLAIIDTAPHSESASLAAARAANLILIPCRPAILDLRAISNTIDIAHSTMLRAINCKSQRWGLRTCLLIRLSWNPTCGSMSLSCTKRVCPSPTSLMGKK